MEYSTTTITRESSQWVTFSKFTKLAPVKSLTTKKIVIASVKVESEMLANDFPQSLNWKQLKFIRAI